MIQNVDEQAPSSVMRNAVAQPSNFMPFLLHQRQRSLHQRPLDLMQ